MVFSQGSLLNVNLPKKYTCKLKNYIKSAKHHFLKTNIVSDNLFFYKFRILTDQKGLVMLPLLYYPASLFVSILPLANTFSLLLPVNYMALCCVCAFTAYTRTQWLNLTFLGYVYIFSKKIEQSNWVQGLFKNRLKFRQWGRQPIGPLIPSSL